MPREHAVKEQKLTAQQQKPHLAIRGANEQWLTIPTGAVIAHVEDASRIDGVFPWALIGVERKKWKFKCPCGRPGCTREMTASLKYTGRHQGEGLVSK